MVEETVLVKLFAMDVNAAETINRVNKAITRLRQPATISGAIATTQFRNVNAELKALGSTGFDTTSMLTEKFKQFSLQTMGFNKVMAMSRETLNQLNEKGWQKNLPFMGRMANQTRMMTHGLRGFRMELLGV